MKEIFARIDRAWAKLIWLLMGAAAAYIGLMLLSILYITIFRTAGWNYSPISFVLIEYGFVYMLFLGSPWLIRNRGHVYIEMLTAALSAPSRVCLSRLITLCCATICFIWAWYSGQLVYEEYTNDVYDELRTQFDIYRWIITIAFPLGFLLMGIEFIRFLFLKEPMHQGIAGIASEHAEIEEQKALAAGRR